jgi:hypothetical protein
MSGDGHRPGSVRRPDPSWSTAAVSRAPPASKATRTTPIVGLPPVQRPSPGRRRPAPIPRPLPQRPQTMRPERLRSAFTAQLPHSGHAIALCLSRFD